MNRLSQLDRDRSVHLTEPRPGVARSRIAAFSAFLPPRRAALFTREGGEAGKAASRGGGHGRFLPKLAALLLAALLLTALPGCGPSPGGGALPTESCLPPHDTAAAEELPAPVPPRDAEAAAARYQQSPLDYIPLEREAEQPETPPPEARFALGADGIWHGTHPRRENEALLMLTGDLMCQTRQQEAGRTGSGYDFRGSFRYVKPILGEADLVMGNLEATLSQSAPYMAEQKSVEGRPHLNAPASFLDALRYAGFDLVTMSNNHNCDAGVRGVWETLDRVEDYHLLHTGLFRGPREPRYTVVEVNGLRIGILSYATYFNHKEEHFTQEGVRILLNPYAPEIAARDMAAARSAGAEFLLVCIHWGQEYQNSPNESQRRMAQELADAGADYIIGSHPHALQPYEELESADGRRVPVLYSMGNFVSHQEKVVTKDTLILRLLLRRDAEGQVRPAEEGYIPCRVFRTFLGESYAVVPVTAPYHQGLRSKYFLPAYERITEILGPDLRPWARLPERIRKDGLPGGRLFVLLSIQFSK